MKTFIAPAVSVLLIGLILVVAKLGKDRYEQTHVTPLPELTASEARLADLILEGEKENLLHDASRLFFKGLPRRTHVDISKDNEVGKSSAEAKYLGVTQFLSIKANGVDTSFFQAPVVMMRSEKTGIQPLLNFNEMANSVRVGETSIGQTLYLICTGNGYAEGSPSFKDCDFADDYLKRYLYGEGRLQFLTYIVTADVLNEFDTACSRNYATLLRCLERPIVNTAVKEKIQNRLRLLQVLPAEQGA